MRFLAWEALVRTLLEGIRNVVPSRSELTNVRISLEALHHELDHHAQTLRDVQRLLVGQHAQMLERASARVESVTVGTQLVYNRPLRSSGLQVLRVAPGILVQVHWANEVTDRTWVEKWQPVEEAWMLVAQERAMLVSENSLRFLGVMVDTFRVKL